MTIGSMFARARENGATLSRKLLSTMLAVVLAVSLVPSAAWAGDGESSDDASLPSVSDRAAAEAVADASENEAESPSPEAPGTVAPAPASEASEPLAVGGESSTTESSDPTDFSNGGGRVAPSAIEDADASSSDAPASARAASSIDGVRIKTAAGAALPSVLGPGKTLQAWAFVEEEDEWGWDTEEVEIPDYAGATFQWYRGSTLVSYASGASSYRDYVPIDGADGRTYQTTEGDAGSCLAVKMSMSGTERWSSASTPRVTDGKIALSSVAVDGKAKEGQRLAATAYDEPSDDWDDPEPVEAGVSFRWLVADAANGTFDAIEGATEATFDIGSSEVGKYLKVEASSGTVVASQALGPVVAAGSPESEARLADAIEALESDGFGGYVPSPVYGQDSNVNVMIEAKLADLGFDDVSSRVSSFSFADPDPAQTGSIDASDGDANGDVTYFFLAPEEKTSSRDYSVLFGYALSFSLTCGDAVDSYEPKASKLKLPWDEGKVSQYLETLACGDFVDAAIAAGSVPEATAELGLATAIYDGSVKTAQITWSSSNASAAKVVSSYDGATVRFTHAAVPMSATLTATFALQVPGYGSAPKSTYDKAFPVEIEAKSAATTEQVRVQLESILEKAQATQYVSGDAVDPDAVDGDLRFPTPRALGISDGSVYRLSYSSSDASSIEVNGYRGIVTRPLEGEVPRSAVVTASLAYDGVTVQRTLGTYALAPVTDREIEAAVSLMNEVEAGYRDALLGSNASASTVMADLDPFCEATSASDGSVVWARFRSEAVGDGIVPDDLPGYDPMGSQPWRTFRSSAGDVVKDENLLVSRPEYDRDVTVDSALTYKRYESLAAAHPGHLVLQSLVKRPVSASFTVLGTKGGEDPHVAATCSIIGLDASGATQTWAAAEPYELDKGATVADLTEALFAKAGMKAECGIGTWGWALDAVTSPFDAGVTLRWGTVADKGWSFYVNGVAPDVGAGSYVLQPGDRVIWRYGSWNDPAPTDRLSVSCSAIGADAAGASEVWASDATYEVEAGTTAAELTEKMFEKTNIAHVIDSSHGWYLSSVTSPYDAHRTLEWNTVPNAYWQLFVNGAWSKQGAADCTLQAGDVVTWFYGSDMTLPGQVATTCEVIGVNDAGTAQVWAPQARYTMLAGDTVADLTRQMLASTGLGYAAGTGSHGWYLDAISSPFTGTALGTSKVGDEWLYWQLFVNGVSSSDYPGQRTVEPGDRITWCYSSYGASLPGTGDVVIVPDAPRPSYDSSWSGYGGGAAGGAVVSRPTPAESAEPAWTYRYADEKTGVSDPLIVNGDLYLVVANELRKLDATTGEVLATANVGGSIRYFCRPAYADGVIIVPVDDGSLAAFTADALACVWKTSPLPTSGTGLSYQALSSLTVSNGRVFAAFTMVGAGGVGAVGTLVCASIQTGEVLWAETNGSPSGPAGGYYWAGAAASGDDIVIGDDAGMVKLVDGTTGATKASASLGAPCRAGIVAVPAKGRSFGSAAYLAVTTDGVLHRIERDGDSLAVRSSVAFAAKSTSMPAVVGGKAFVCGVDDGGYGTLSVIDVDAMSVEHAVRGGMGEAQCAPLVSVQSDGTYAYFTCNGRPGGVYGYRLGDASAYALFTPEGSQQEYTTSSVIADEEGNLYYTNDSGTLFALKGRPGAKVTFEANGGTYVAPRYAALGSALLRPDDPVRDGYEFSGWYADRALTTAWDFDTELQGPLTLYAKWTAKRGQGGSGGGSGEQPPQSQEPTSEPLPTGAPAATRLPLAKAVLDEEEKAVEAVSADATRALRDTGASAATSTTAADADAGIGGHVGGANPWALGGIALGVMGLVGAAAYVARARRRNGEER